MSVEQIQIERITGWASGMFHGPDRRDQPLDSVTHDATFTKNFHCHETKLIKRNGYAQQADSGAATSTISSIYSGNNNIMVTDSDGDIYTLSGGTLTNRAPATMTNSSVSWASLNSLDICNDGTNTKKWDGATIADLGGTPPTGDLLATYQNRLWIGSSSSSLLRFSEVEDPEDWTIFTAGIEVDKGSRENVVAIVPVADRLVVFKEASIHHIVGFNVETFQRLPANSQVGCISKDSIVEVSDSANPRWNGLYWADGSGIYFSQDLGVTVEKVTDRINAGSARGPDQGLFDDISAKGDIYAARVASVEEIWFSHRIAGSENNQVLAWNYRLGHWSPMYLSPPFRCIAEVLVSGERLTYAGDSDATTNGLVYDVNVDDFDDAGTEIDCGFVLKVFNWGGIGIKKTLRRVRIIHSVHAGIAGDVRIRTTRDREAVEVSDTTQSISADGQAVFDFNITAQEFRFQILFTGLASLDFFIDAIEIEYNMDERQ